MCGEIRKHGSEGGQGKSRLCCSPLAYPTDMLAFAQAIHDRQLEFVVPVFTGGASVSWAMRSWFQEHNQVGYLLVPDPDEAGKEWGKAIRAAIRKGKGVSYTAHPPKGLDPDEAILQGWWPEGI